MLTSILSAIVILGLLIIVHESGHFLVAKRLGVRVLRFSIGYPPRIAGIRRGETEYVIGATPAGGYVRMLGEEIGDEPRSDELHTFLVELGHDLAQVTRETALTADGAPAAPHEIGAAAIDQAVRDPDDRDRGIDHSLDELLESLASRPLPLEGWFSRPLKSEELILLNRIRMLNSARRARVSLQQNPPEELLAAFRARAFPSQPLWKRFAIVLAGPAANMLFAPILLTLVYMYGVPTPVPVIDELTPGMPAVEAGLKSGDQIVAIDNKAISSWEELSDAVKASKGAPLNLEIERPAGQAQGRMNLTVTAKRQDVKTPYGTSVNEWIIGVTPRETTHRLNPLAAAYHAVVISVSLTGQMVVGIAMIVSGTVPLRDSVGGPIAIVRLAGQEARHGLLSVAMFTVMLSLELGLVNLLPVPLLDGGHLAFFAYEGVRGKPLAMRHREIALQVGLFLIVALFAFLIFNDISHIVQG
jgi:regulator of sigma E protease